MLVRVFDRLPSFLQLHVEVDLGQDAHLVVLSEVEEHVVLRVIVFALILVQVQLFVD